MPRITLRELRSRTRHVLLSDLKHGCHVGNELVSVRAAERKTEKRFPLHGALRRAAIHHFDQAGWDVYPHGIGVAGAFSAMSDLAIARDRKVIFVECFTPWRVWFEFAQEKRRLEEFFPLWFVVERPNGEHPGDYRARVHRLSKRNPVFMWTNGRAQLSRARTASRP